MEGDVIKDSKIKMKSAINYKTGIFSLLVIFMFLFSVSDSLALNTKLSEEAVQVAELLNQAERDISEMAEKNISINRVDEIYQEASQLYSAQLALEEKGGKENYKLVIKRTSEISSIKKVALEANDELKIFKETFHEAVRDANLSEMQEEYNQIILSFNEERFEDTLELINKGYSRMSEIQSSQTAVNAVYLATSRTIKNFFINHGLKIVIIFFATLLFALVFQNNMKKLMKRIKLNNLITQKEAINTLLKNIQKDYFKIKKLSEGEYTIKLKKFKELIRDIDRQVMILKEELFKIKKKNKR